MGRLPAEPCGIDKSLLHLICFLFSAALSFALNDASYVSQTPSAGSFCLARPGASAVLYVDADADPGIRRAAADLQADIARVTGTVPAIVHDLDEMRRQTVIIGEIGKSALIDRLVKEGQLDAGPLAGKWESFLIEVVANPLAGVDQALIIAGSDKRGTIYGIYDLSEQIGVSPWYWWADVPVQTKESLYVHPGRYVQGPPAVKYRGIFLNDEAPALTNWVLETYGDYNHAFYTKVFELILRLKGNFLWPAMWNNSFATDDALNPKLADEYGIVIGTSHHEPMMRAWKEWERAGHRKGSWDYSKNAATLRDFWTEGVRRTKDYEKIVTLAMRGDGDEPMSEGDNIALLEKIVTDQRQIIADIVNPDMTAVPQVWALYKEVQGYYEKGMRVPDDVILLWCDDNWGNLRRLPTESERRRRGGAGVYYHFDYVGGPRSYRWINTNPIPKIWEQMNLAHQYEANEIWIVNVGDLKPMEFPIEFFLTLAWNPSQWPKEKLPEYTRLWAAREFGPLHAEAIADIIDSYTKYNGRRKPELLEPTTYSLIHYREAERVTAAFKRISDQAEKLYQQMPPNARDAFFQLVLHPAKASALVNELYVTVGMNRLYAAQKRAAANDLADKAKALFEADASLTREYHQLGDGRWNHMMDQTHIGYTNWNNPPKNILPKVEMLDLPDAARMGIALEGSAATWPTSGETPQLPEFSVYTQQTHVIEIFNEGTRPFGFTAKADAPWILVSDAEGTIDKQTRLGIRIDWDKAPGGTQRGIVRISGAGVQVDVHVVSVHPQTPARDKLEGFVESNGYVSIEAEHYTSKIDTDHAAWEKIPGYGRTLSAMSIFPVTASSVQPPQDAPCLEYKIYLFHPGEVQVQAILAPSLNIMPGRGVRLAMSFDDHQPKMVEIVPAGFAAENGNRAWERAVSRNAWIVSSSHTIDGIGYHTLKVWMVDPGIVIEKLIIDAGGLKPSYLGPPESFRGSGEVNSSAN